MGIRVISTIIAAAESYDLTTLENVKSELNITDDASDAVLERYIAGASASIAQFCGRRFQVETVKDEFWPDREFYAYQVQGAIPSLQLSRWPAVTVSTVTENDIALDDGSDFSVDKDNGLLLRLDGLKYPTVWGAWPISVTYDGGFEPIPPDVEDAAIRMVKARFLAKGRDPNLKQENIVGVREVSYWIATGSDAGNMTPDIEDILDNYRPKVLV